MFQTLHAAADAVRQKQTTPLELLDACLANIERWENKVHAWVFVDRQLAREDAKRLTEELKRGQYRGPLHGIPIAVKDIFDVFDWPTAAGSKLWANSVARQDASIVANLRAAGAVFIGKTVTTQYASFDPPVTRNPWNLERTPGGSSSGSAAAVACGMCLGALGSQTGGSLTRPATYCGIATMKPTFGLLDADGVMPLAPSMDHPGPMGRCVADLAILMQGMAGGRWVGDTWSWWENYTAPEKTEPPTLGRVRGLFDERAEPSVRTMMDDVSAKLHAKGATVIEHGLPALFSEVVSRHRMVMAVEAAGYHEHRLRRHPDDYLPKIRSLLEEGLACPAPEYARTKEHQRRLKEEMVWQDVDVLLTPATTCPAPAADTTGDPAFNSPWSYTGLPTVSFPTGHFADGLPLAIQLVGRANEEKPLLAAAAWCEQVLGAKPLNPGAA
jgi:Asp-tRNA(Asn)/Glu-tRNA(Gln) amidotransferase A subunit family amidase